MSDGKYNIDEILKEAQRLREKADDGSSIRKEKSASSKERLQSALDKVTEIQDSMQFTMPIKKIQTQEKEKSPEAATPPKKKKNSRRGFVPKQQETKDEKVDLFDFQLEKREKPIQVGPYGEKHFRFQQPQQKKEEVVPEPVSPPEKITAAGDFDFESISHKIDGLQQDEKSEFAEPTEARKSPYESSPDNPYLKLAFGKDKRNPKPTTPAFNFKKGGEGADVPLAGGEDLPKPRKSLFETFATGTGRELKIEDIKKIDFGAVEGAGGGFYDDEDDEFYDGMDIPDGAILGFSEFSPQRDRRDVSREIANTKLGIFVRTGVAALVTFLLFYLVFAMKYVLPIPKALLPDSPDTLKTSIIVCVVLLGVLLLACGKTAISGVISLFKMQANSDTLVTFALLGSIFQGIQAIRHIDLVVPAAMNLFFPVAALTMLFNCIGKLSMLGRIQSNFRITAGKVERRGVQSVESPAYCKDLLPHVTESQPTIAYSSKANFFSDFLSLSFSTKYDVGINRAVAPVSILGAFVVAVATRFLTGSPLTAASAFAGVLCICTTLSTTFIENIPLAKLAKKLNPMGAMVSGNKAVETFCDTNAVVLTENEIFPKGHVYLNGIKAFPNGQIDDAILDAASVLCVLGGSLSHLFLDMIGGDKRLLKKVDNVVYENGMGLSGWVDSRRVLIGNRKLMQNHGITLPNDSYEKAYPVDTPGNPIYVSNTGEACARFLVEYTVDEELAYQLDQLAMKEKELIIYTTDANIDANKIWQLYGYPMDLITIMPSELQDEFREISDTKEELPAEIVFTGKPASFVAAILATINARASILSATIVQLFQIILGYGIVALMSFMGYIGTFSVPQMVLYQVFWFVAIFIVQQFRKP